MERSDIIGDSHSNRIQKDQPKEGLPNTRVYVKSFSNANNNQFDYSIFPVLVDEKPNNVVIHPGSNDIKKFNYNNLTAEESAHRIISIGLKYRSYEVSNMAVSSILKKK